MLEQLRDYFWPRPSPTLPPAPTPVVPRGTRYYVIGDIHGRLDLYDALIARIEEEIAASRGVEVRIVLLGDLVDRGPDSAGVLVRTREWQAHRNVRVLAGNHEEMFLAAFEKPEALRHFIKHGGRETIMSYGLSAKRIATVPIDELFERLPKVVPTWVRDYIAGFENMIIAGDYVFVHAGIDPELPLDQQKRSDLRWIRDRFLKHEGSLEKVVVHGHTIFEQVTDCGNRIGIDTGAFRSGVLTALVLEGDQRRILQACATGDGQIEVVEGERQR
jgi:serine/threonine protein phosphatase 1